MPSTAAPWCCTARALHQCLCRAPCHAHRTLVLGSRCLGRVHTHATHTLVRHWSKISVDLSTTMP
eukprot:4139763-Alexandrium_andersonii.AAC.1